MARRSIGWPLVLLGLAAVLPWSSGTARAQERSVPPEALIRGGQPPDLVLLHTGDVVGYLDPCG